VQRAVVETMRRMVGVTKIRGERDSREWCGRWSKVKLAVKVVRRVWQARRRSVMKGEDEAAFEEVRREWRSLWSWYQEARATMSEKLEVDEPEMPEGAVAGGWEQWESDMEVAMMEVGAQARRGVEVEWRGAVE